MILNIGDKVLYEDEEYTVFWFYDSEYIEIAQGYSNIKLVHVSEIGKEM
ncbi:MAG: hypothetical protein ACQEWI_10840 [Bacillota bacterium]